MVSPFTERKKKPKQMVMCELSLYYRAEQVPGNMCGTTDQATEDLTSLLSLVHAKETLLPNEAQRARLNQSTLSIFQLELSQPQELNSLEISP